MRGGVVQDQLVKMFYKNIARITWLQTTKVLKVLYIDYLQKNTAANELGFYRTIY